MSRFANSCCRRAIAVISTAGFVTKMKNTEHGRRSTLTVRGLLTEEGTQWSLELVAGRAGLHRRILAPRIQKPGLALAGYVQQIHPGRVQVIGNPELSYLQSMPPLAARRAVERICS